MGFTPKAAVLVHLQQSLLFDAFLNLGVAHNLSSVIIDGHGLDLIRIQRYRFFNRKIYWKRGGHDFYHRRLWGLIKR
jgi:hypothetical protein